MIMEKWKKTIDNIFLQHFDLQFIIQAQCSTEVTYDKMATEVKQYKLDKEVLFLKINATKEKNNENYFSSFQFLHLLTFIHVILYCGMNNMLWQLGSCNII